MGYDQQDEGIKMIKVLFIILGLDFSGAENVLIQYLDQNQEIDPYFAFIYKGKAKVEFLNTFGKDKVFDLSITYSKNELRIVPLLAQMKLKKAILPVIEQLKPEVVYFNNTHEVILSRALISQLSVPCIGHVHDMKNSIGTFPKKHEAKCAFKELDKVLTVSDACKDSWKCTRMKVIYNGICDEYFEGVKNTANHSPITIGYVGMLSKRKGFDLLVSAIEMLDESIDWRIAYNLVEKEFIEPLERIKNKKNVQVIYQIPRSQMSKFYDSIDILLIPSRQDPLPTVAIEAMARKTLVLGANTGGIPELLRSEKFLFAVNDLKAMENKILHYCSLKQEEFAECSEYQYEQAVKRFRNSRKQKQINLIISECLLGNEE